ncbi:MAG: TRAP transporter substrate-binding protein [Betaproteobacteria bacterium]|nr:MAG: TRAP transporter substrate-binding protein [Betaproteobacteria bacterium]
MRMAEEQRAVAAEVVDVLVAVDVPLARTGSARDVDRIGGSRARIVREARRQGAARLRIEGGGTRRAGAVQVFDHAVYYVSPGGDPMLTRTLGAIAVGLSFSVCAQDLPKTQFKVIGLNSPTVASIVDEVPFWRETLPKASNGAISADITPLDQMGIDDKTMLRLLRLGVMDFAGMDISKMAGDDPRFEGCDLAGITLDADKARAGCEAYRSVIDRQMQKNWNARLLAFGGNPPQVFWCRGLLGGLSDLKGKKVRVFNNTMRDFLGGIGATAVSMAFAEVVPALNNGVVDCGVTGSLSGNTAGWPEVTKSLYPMSLGWSINVMAVNLASWNRLDKRVQNFLLEQVQAYENKMWTTLKKATAEADNCNTGRQPCTMGKLAHITIVPVKPAEAETHKKLVEGAVLAGWAKRCGGECAAEWNNTVGKTLGLRAPTN